MLISLSNEQRSGISLFDASSNKQLKAFRKNRHRVFPMATLKKINPNKLKEYIKIAQDYFKTKSL